MERRLGSAVARVTALAAVALTLGACSQQDHGNNAATPEGVATAGGAPPPTPVSSASAPAGANDPKAFLEGLYAHYKTSSSAGTSWAPMDANVHEVFDPDTVALLAADTKALKGQLGEIDGDWLCDCQDWGAITSAVTITSQTPTTAKAEAVFRDTQVPDEKGKRDTFDLVKTPAGWRIHDMGTREDASLRHVLTVEIAGLKSGAARPLSD